MPENENTEKIKAFLAVCMAALLWSSGGVLIKIISWDSPLIAWGRALFGGIFLFLFTRTRTLKFSPIQIAGGLAYAATSLAFVLAMKLTLAANVVMLQYTAPVFASILGILFLKEFPRKIDWIVLPLVIGGIYLMVASGTAEGSMLGNGLALFSGLSLALLTIAMRKQHADSPLDSIIIGSGLIVICLLPVVLENMEQITLWSLDTALIVFLGAFQVAVPFLFFGYAVKRITAFEATVFKAAEPMLNPFWVFLFTGERPEVIALAGAVLILVTILGRNLLLIGRLRNNQSP